MQRRAFCRSALAMAAAGALPGTTLAAMLEIASDVEAINTAGRELLLKQASVQELADSLRGPLLLPGNAAYERARLVLNPTIDRHPALVVQPSGVSDISNAVQFAADHGLEIAIKCGGHSYSGRSTTDGGLMIDLSGFRHVRVDPATKVAHVSGGSLLGALDHEAMAHGLVTVAGTVSHTGVGGLTTGGGFGRLARRFGLALDNVRSLDVVCADGRLRHCRPGENEDLYWGVRGGGSNFGVVTSFEFQLHPMDRTVMAGSYAYPIERLREVLSFYGEFSSQAPDELYMDLVAGYPAGGQGFLMLAGCYTGDPARMDRALAPLEQLGKPLRGGFKPVDYVALQRSGDNTAPRSIATYMKGGYTSEITPALADALAEGLQPHQGRTGLIVFQHSGGAIKRVPADATAFPHRYAEHNMMVIANWKAGQPEDQAKEEVRAHWAALEPHTHGFYVNEADEENAPASNRNYQGNYPRLLAIKKRYDPENFFRLNANVTPPA